MLYPVRLKGVLRPFLPLLAILIAACATSTPARQIAIPSQTDKTVRADQAAHTPVDGQSETPDGEQEYQEETPIKSWQPVPFPTLAMPISRHGMIQERIARMDLREKLAQHFIVWIARNADAAAIESLKELRPAGYIVYPWNYASLADLRALTSKLASTGMDEGEGTQIVPFICADQEGGRVAAFRFKEFPVQPSAFLLGSLGDPAIVEAAAFATALQLKYLGLNMNLAPVADLYSKADSTIIGDRSFGPDPAATGTAVAAYVRGLTRGGVIPTLKHFPGHGVTTIDSHAELPVVSGDRVQLIEHDMLPFGEGIRAGAPVVMTAHILYPAIDPINPATLSPLILNDLLRDTLGFDGIILTDGFEMGALSKTLGKRESLLRALQAGINLILLYNRYAPAEMIDLMESLVLEGLVSMDTIDRNVERILMVKAAYGLLELN